MKPRPCRRAGHAGGCLGLTLAGVLASAQVAGVPDADARCTRPIDLQQFVASTGRALRCRQHRLTGGVATRCKLVRPPACADAAAADVVALVYGDENATRVDGRALRHQLSCQAAIGRASTRFLRLRLAERAHHDRAERGSRSAFRLLLGRCDVGLASDPGGSGLSLPLLGAPCSGSVTSGGRGVDSTRLIECLRPSLERIVDRVAPTHLRPNVILVNTDDQRWDTLWVMPTIEEMASRGVTFTNSFVTTPLCAPSRASLFTSRYAHDTGVLDTGGVHGGAHVFDDTSTIATWLQAAGYHTGHFGKYLNGYLGISPHVPPGWEDFQALVEDSPLYFDYHLAENGDVNFYGSTEADYSTDLLAGRVRDFVDAHADVPFFVYYAPFAPHAPAIPAPRHAGMLATLPPWRPPSYNQPDLTGKPGWVVLQTWFSTPTKEAANDQFRIDQLETLLAVDEAVDGFLAQLARLGLDDDTVVIFTSDNGYAWGEHWWWGKECGYEECIRVPLVIRYPGAPSFAPRRESGYASNLDLAPTVAELAEATVPSNVNGRSLVALLDGRDGPRTDVLGEYWVRIIPVIPTWRGLRTDRWKYIHNANTAGVGFLELYDLVNDPYETTNRAGDPVNAAVLDAMGARVDELYVQ